VASRIGVSYGIIGNIAVPVQGLRIGVARYHCIRAQEVIRIRRIPPPPLLTKKAGPQPPSLSRAPPHRQQERFRLLSVYCKINTPF
jgi:hypothetical protein